MSSRGWHWAVALLCSVSNLSAIEVKELQESHEREIGASAKFLINGIVTQAQFLKCVPQESHPLPQKWPEELRRSVFSQGAARDLADCELKDCAFNFSSTEIEGLMKAKNDDERWAAFQEIYQKRSTGASRPAADREAFWIRSANHPLGICRDPQIAEVLDHRPSSKLARRLSHVQYNKKMRQTTRLLQATQFKMKSPPEGFCFVEALIFSDHYDLDRVEAWQLKRVGPAESEIQVEVRHRIDFLNSWFRRLNKPKLARELREALEKQAEVAQNCLNSANSQKK